MKYVIIHSKLSRYLFTQLIHIESAKPSSMINEGSLLQTFESQTINVQFDKLNVHFLFQKRHIHSITNIVQAFSYNPKETFGYFTNSFFSSSSALKGILSTFLIMRFFSTLQPGKTALWSMLHGQGHLSNNLSSGSSHKGKSGLWWSLMSHDLPNSK